MDKYSPTTVARFWSKVDVRKKNECWEWLGSRRHNGYGGLKVNGRVERSNRIAWELFHQESLGDRQALHKCDNPACCNPNHIYAGTESDNMYDTHHRGRMISDKLSLEQADEIRALKAGGASARALAADFNVSEPTIHKICCGRMWNADRKPAQ